MTQESQEDAVRRLMEPDHTADIPADRGRSIEAEISNAMVGLKKQYYGRGPTKAVTYVNDNYLLCVLQGGLTRNEETLLEAGKDELVRQYRLQFQETMAKTTTDAVERLTGRRVMTYNSQTLFRPTRSFEIFVLDEPPG